MSTEVTGTETLSFQAETRQLLDLVIHSLYTNREIFVRELVSNASDALERLRHEQLTKPELIQGDQPLEIRIELDEEKRLFTIRDSGDGMTREQLVSNLGTIAKSGTKSFLANLADAAKADANLIGQFGVGFYSAFMAADRVTVETKSYEADAQGWRWESDGTGEFTVAPQDGLTRGTKITLHLREDAAEFAQPWRVKEIIRRFSAFVPFPVLVGEERVNTVQALWKRNKNEIKDEDYTEFYKFHASTGEEPLYRLHFSADAPIAINAVLFVPPDTFERMGLGVTKPGVDLYCRNVMIMKGPEELLPEWMRFVKGVIESEDLPLNISRETLQDNGLVRKLSRVIVGKFLKFLEEQAKTDAEKYAKFYENFGFFLHEGLRTDFAHRNEIAKLLRFQSNRSDATETVSLPDYIGRMVPGQEAIYYLNGSSREAIEAGPYLEVFRERGIEVLYTTDAYQDYTLANLGEFEGKKLISADSNDLQLPGEAPQREGEALSDEQAGELCGFLKTVLGERVHEVKISHRLVASPAVAVAATPGMTHAMQRLMAALNRSKDPERMTTTLEVNPRHPLIRRLAALRGENEALATELALTLHDTSLLAAGLMQDPKDMVGRLNGLLTKVAGAV